MLAQLPIWYWIMMSVLFGALWGSFANVVIARWPLGQSVVRPGSHCFKCNTPIRFYDNIPILSYLVLKGRCRHCGATFSPRYAIVEAASALLSGAVMWHVAPWTASHVGMALVAWLSLFAFLLALCIVAAIDLEHYLIPDSVVLPGAVLGIVANGVWLNLGWTEPIVAAAISYAGLRLLFIDGYTMLTGRAGMGLGDAKLLAFIGAFMGYEGVLFALFAGAMQGSVVGVAMVLYRRRDGLGNEPVFEEELDEEGNPKMAQESALGKARVPFGPFLCLGAMQYYFIGQYLVTAYSNAVGQLVYGIPPL